jgi:hypothetical protein
MEFQHARQELSHERGMQVILWAIKKGADLMKNLISR